MAGAISRSGESCLEGGLESKLEVEDEAIRWQCG